MTQQSWGEARRDRLERDRQARANRIARHRDRREEEEEEEERAPATRSTKRAGAARRGLLRYDRVPVALVGYAVLALWWAVGGRYTIDGTPLLVNTILRFFHVGSQLGAITDPVWYLRLCWAPVLISVIERKNRPRAGLSWNVAMVYAIGIWLIVLGLDWASTYLAVTNPDPDAWPLAIQVAANPLLAGTWSTITTLLPEIGFAAMWKFVRG